MGAVHMQQLLDSALLELAHLQRDADDNFDQENTSAINIQRTFRGAQLRAHVTTLHRAAVEIERTFRGFLGRKYVAALLAERDQSRQLAVYDWCAVQIQKLFRAFYSRKYKHDHAVRRAYLTSVEEKGNELRRALERHAEELQRQEEEIAMENVSRRFEHLTQSTHYLVSTRAIPGVYNPPTLFAEVPTINDVPLEEHMRAGVRDLLRRSGYTRKPLIQDANGVLRVPYKGQKYRLSLQASVRYDVLEEARKQEQLRHKYSRLGPARFEAGGRLKPPPYKRGIHEGDQFLEPWKNPYNVRGIPPSQQTLRERDLSFTKAPDTPFVTAVGGNKSSVLPNDVFDVVYEAEQSGGVSNRSRGTTMRFGIPDTCDARGLESPRLRPVPPRTTNTASRKPKYVFRSHSAPAAAAGQSGPVSLDSSIDMPLDERE